MELIMWYKLHHLFPVKLQLKLSDSISRFVLVSFYQTLAKRMYSNSALEAVYEAEKQAETK